MQRILLLLFIIPIFLFLFFGFGLLIDLNFGESTYLYLISYIITLIIVSGSYIQLWNVNRGLSSKFSKTTLWIAMIISLLIVPVIFYSNSYINNSKNIAENELYERTHCKEVTTKKHKYIVKVCDNEKIIGDQTGVSEYIEELNK